MGRPSKLSPDQWQQIAARMDRGEGVRALAREFGISPGQISNRFSKQSERVREVAGKLAEAQTALAALPSMQQHQALSLADELRQISTHLAGAARFGSATAHRLAGVAHAKVQEMDDANPLSPESMEALKGVAALTKLANDASSIGINLLAANKETVKAINDRPPVAKTVDPKKVSTAALKELMSARDGVAGD